MVGCWLKKWRKEKKQTRFFIRRWKGKHEEKSYFFKEKVKEETLASRVFFNYHKKMKENVWTALKTFFMWRRWRENIDWRPKENYKTSHISNLMSKKNPTKKKEHCAVRGAHPETSKNLTAVSCTLSANVLKKGNCITEPATINFFDYRRWKPRSRKRWPKKEPTVEVERDRAWADEFAFLVLIIKENNYCINKGANL